MIDSMIDVALAILIIGVLVFLVRYGGYGISNMMYKIKKKSYDRKYPIQSSKFPLRCLKYGDQIELKDIGIYKYLGKQENKYYIESVSSDGSNKDLPYIYADEFYLDQNAVKLMNKYCTKWENEEKQEKK